MDFLINEIALVRNCFSVSYFIGADDLSETILRGNQSCYDSTCIKVSEVSQASIQFEFIEQ